MSTSVRILMISILLIKKFKVGEIADKALAMSAAIFGLPLVFTGVKPFTEAQILTLVNTYNSAKAAFKVGGKLAKPAYLAAKLALLNCILAFVPYVNDIALGDEIILDLSTLPNNKPTDYAALISAGAKAKGISAVIGMALQIIADCLPFGTGVGYCAILSEEVQLPIGFTMAANGQVCIPEVITHRIFVNVTQSRRKLFNNLKPGTTYYLYYVLMVGDTVGLLSNCVPVSSAAVL